MLVAIRRITRGKSETPKELFEATRYERRTMSTLNKTHIRKSNMSILRLALLSCLTAAGLLLVPLAAAQNGPESADANHEHSSPAVPPQLVPVVRTATRYFWTLTLLPPPTTSHCSAASAVRITGQWACPTATFHYSEMARSMPRGRKR
jgi:hypothetical protein